MNYMAWKLSGIPFLVACEWCGLQATKAGAVQRDPHLPAVILVQAVDAVAGQALGLGRGHGLHRVDDEQVRRFRAFKSRKNI